MSYDPNGPAVIGFCLVVILWIAFGWLIVRWMYLNYKASRIIIERTEWQDKYGDEDDDDDDFLDEMVKK